MKSTKILMLVLVTVILTLTACKTEKLQPTDANQIPNPASVFCKENGGTEENRQAADGSVAGFCLFSDGSECDEWAYFRGECKVGDSLKPTEAVVTPGSTLQPGTETVTDWWGIIKNAPAARSMMITLNDRIWDRLTSPMALIQWTQLYSPRSWHCVTAARSFIFMAHYSVRCLTSTDHRSKWIASS